MSRDEEMEAKRDHRSGPADAIGSLVGKLVGTFLGQALDHAVKQHECKAQTAELLKECIPCISQGIAEICPGGIPDPGYAPIMVVCGNTEGSLCIGLKDWMPEATLNELADAASKLGLNNADLWGDMCRSINKSDPTRVLCALLVRLGPEGLKAIQTQCYSYAQRGFTPVVVVACRQSPDGKRASGFCTTTYLPGREDAQSMTKH